MIWQANPGPCCSVGDFTAALSASPRRPPVQHGRSHPLGFAVSAAAEDLQTHRLSIQCYCSLWDGLCHRLLRLSGDLSALCAATATGSAAVTLPTQHATPHPCGLLEYWATQHATTPILALISCRLRIYDTHTHPHQQHTHIYTHIYVVIYACWCGSDTTSPVPMPVSTSS